MAGPKARTPDPIDRPLSKAYLREFKGWSTAAPPGISDPTSLRIMEDVIISREGGAQIRPALRSVLPEGFWLDHSMGAELVGGWEHFFLNDGRRALLFAVRLANKTVTFRVGVYNESLKRFEVKNLTDAGISFEIPQGLSVLNFSSKTTFVTYLQIDNKILALSDGGEDLRMFYVGEKKRARKVTPISRPSWSSGDALEIRHPDAAWINGSQTANSLPAAQAKTTQTLISSTAADNKYNYGFFYTFENEVGESAASQVTYVKAQRGWSQWQFFKPDASGNKTSTGVTEPEKAMDQFVAIIPAPALTAALAEGALKANLYMFTYSDQDSVPPEGILVSTRDLTDPNVGSTLRRVLRATAAVDLESGTMIRPTKDNRYNYSNPSSAGQGLVAGDRLILVNDSANAALIRWTSNLTGQYTNFTPSRGGGFKTLTSGNLLVPSAVKLWQNPQAVDTITILCSGVDGKSASFYMAPASVDGQTASTAIMGFEETNATPGTVSPYGVEVFNNALYHPLDSELMKSTANNYTINHSTVTTDIANQWVELRNKRNIISAQHDNRLYYLVDNPGGEPLEDGCKGNEIWVYDGAKDAGSWNRWKVQGISLDTLDIGGKLYMALARPEGIFVFDEFKISDDVSVAGGTLQRAIPWKLESNTQGANRAHDAWAYVQQANITVGNFRGSMRYGIRGRDSRGRPFEIAKIFRRPIDASFDDSCGCQSREPAFDFDDNLRINRDMQEWYFFAEHVVDEDGEVERCFGQINYVQFLFTPVSVNVGYAEGSVETFEYGRDTARAASSYTVNGVTTPFADVRRP